MDTAWYIWLLNSAFFVMLLGYDGYRYFRRLRFVENLQKSIGELPPMGDDIEKTLVAQIDELKQELADCRLKLYSNKSAEMEYYTLWVHQVKTPISAMRFVLQDMDGEQAAVLEQELFKIEQYADLALRYVRLEEISSNRVLDHCDLNKIVSGAVKKYALLFVYQGLTVNIDKLPCDVPSDPQWLAFIIEQLISNAVKYTKQGGVSICWKDEALVIEDSGIGIRAEDIPRIFEKGYTGYNGRLDGRASGIGLYLCKRTADGLGIKLSIKSEPSKGTQARLRFVDRLWTE